MDAKAISETLRILATGKDRTKAAQLREVLGEVESALAAGVRYASVIAALKQHGLDMPMGTFKATLTRLRSQGARQKVPPARVSSTPPGTAEIGAGAPPDASDPQAAPASPPATPYHDPRELHEIFRSTPDLAALTRIAKQRKNAKP